MFDRARMSYFPLRERLSKVSIPDACIKPEAYLKTKEIPASLKLRVDSIAAEIAKAKKRGASVVCAFGAHSIKNGLGQLLGSLLKKGWFTHLAANGAAVIHDWEFAFQGKSSEDVHENVLKGKFGTWEETGLYINLALALGAYEGLGYGASVGAMIHKDGLDIPSREGLFETVNSAIKRNSVDVSTYTTNKAAAALDLLGLMELLNLRPGFLSVDHLYKEYSLLEAATQCGRPFTCHPMFGHDIIYTHKANCGAAVGRTAERDFLEYVSSIESLDGGVYLSVGSAVMSPMIFEKALSMARNANGGKGIKDCGIHVVDLQEASWDWSGGEPPMDDPAYYLRFMKTFSRMGCRVDYTSADNRVFFALLSQSLECQMENRNE
ncbi:conserved hypothetical protein [Leadbettera azotonutricia ZAS-9]|uniref:Deoxyhypusine synthase n=2 Tax=Leadbettera azotonutricia TaxID=150829 RepID=F5YD61_LEAAZ|nr:conserved hypothetical protein [Leadbettera azotonutricia ZAS-9]